MNRIMNLGPACAVLLGALTLGCGTTPEATRVDPPAQDRAERMTIWTDRTELFLEYQPLVAGVPGPAWGVHLTDLSDFRPVADARVTLVFEGSGGQTHEFVAASPSRPGLYTPAPDLPAAGMYDLVLRIEGGRQSDEIFVGPIQVFGSVDDLPDLPSVEPVGITFLKEQQWPIEFATVAAGPRAVASGLEAGGELVPVPGRVAEVTAPVSGIVRWDQNREAPAEGSWVRAGQLLVRLSPVGGDDAFAAQRSLAERLTREVARLERLVAVEAAPLKRLEEARHDLEVVQAQLDALDADPDGGYTLTIRAPLDGAVANRRLVPGTRVGAGQPLLTILDPRQLHLRFDVPARLLDRMAGITGASFSAEGSEQVLRAGRLVSIGATLDPLRRTVPVTFQVDNPDRLLRPGMLVTGRLLGPTPAPTLAVPSAAIVDEDGVRVVYVQIAGESFERRAVTLGGTDGLWTAVESGVRAGERVVTRGQYQIRLSALNTSEISDHGHPH